MRGVITKRTVMVLAIVSAISLVALAILQYRWITQLGASERALLNASLERGMRNLRDEFAAELTSIVESTMRGPERAPEMMAARFRAASAAMRYPQALKTVYLSQGTTLLQVTPSKLNPVAWPSYLHHLHQELLEPDSSGPPIRPFWNETPSAIGLPRNPNPPGRGGDRPPPPRPASPSPPREDGPPEESQGPRGHNDPPPPLKRAPSWIIFEFDTDYIRGQIVPGLVAKHLGSGYDVEWVSNGEGAPIRHITQPDASIGLLEFHLEPPPQQRPGGGRSGPELEQKQRPRRPPVAPLFATPRFQLLVKHQSGSLDLQVAGVRNRNMAITAAVLLIMALSSAALVVALNRAEQLNRMQLDFVAGVSHELRTPLAVIRSAGENLADGVVASDKQIRKYGALVRDEGKRLSGMVEQILRFAGVESGRAPYTLLPLSPEQLVDRALQEAQSVLSNVQVEKNVELGLPNVMADEAALSHCLQNLLGNAVKYGDGKWVKVEVMRHGKEVEFAVVDRGPGIDPSDKANLFDPFYRGKKAVSEQVHGLGIGLSLVKRVAESHSGRVDVANLAGGGARFSVFIPVEPHN